MITQVQLSADSELNIYFHSPGQLLRNNHINRFATVNSKNVAPNYGFVSLLLDWEVTLSIEVIDLSKVEGYECLQDQQLYDQCMISQFLKSHNNSVFSSLFLPPNNQSDGGVASVPIDVIQEFLAIKDSSDAISQCPKSCSHFQIQFEQIAKRYSNQIFFLIEQHNSFFIAKFYVMTATF
jgi:hypothetical protein